jgi:hypothetical protein
MKRKVGTAIKPSPPIASSKKRSHPAGGVCPLVVEAKTLRTME